MATQNTDLSNLYDHLQSICGDGCGLVLTIEVFKAILAGGVDALNTPRTIKTSVKDVELSASAKRDSNFAVAIVPGSHGEVIARIAGVTMSVVLHRKGVPADVLSTLLFTVRTVDGRLDIESGRIVGHRLTQDVTSTFTRGTNRDVIITALGWNADDIATLERFENFTLFSAPATVADQVVGNVAGLPLAQWLSGLRLDDPMTIEWFDDTTSGPSVLIRSLNTSAFVRTESCRCAEITASEVEVTNDEALKLAIKASSRTNAPSRAFELPTGSHANRNYAYLYAPEAVLNAAFSPSLYPAVSLGDGGYFGPAQYSWSVVVAFRSLRVEIDTANASLLLKADLSFHLAARAWLNLPCDQELELARADIDGKINNIVIQVEFVFDRTTKRLLLDSKLVNHDVTDLNVQIGGIAALAWPLSVVLALIIKHNAPGMISEQLRSAVSSGRFELIDFRDLLVKRFAALANTQATFADSTGFVFEIGSSGD